MPWAGFAAQKARDAKQSIESSLEDKKFVDAGKGGTLKWSVWAKTKNVNATIALSKPPGFTSISQNCFEARAPRDGSWEFRLDADVKEHAHVKVGGENIFSISPTEHLRLLVTANLAAGVELDTSQPGKPRFKQAKITPTIHVAVDRLFALDATISPTIKSDGTIEFRKQLTDVSFKFGSLSASFDGDFVFVLKPSGFVAGAYVDLEHDVGSEVRKSAYVVGDTLDVHTALQKAEIKLEGVFKAKLKRVGSITDHWSITVPAYVPSVGDLIEMQKLIARQGLPIRWGETVPAAGQVQKETRSIDFAGEAKVVEAGTLKHMPFDNILNFKKGPPARGNSLTYAGEKDSAIWTGHYLAAEAFRYAATQDPDALAHVRKAVTGIERLFAVPFRGAAHGSTIIGKTELSPGTDRSPVTAETGVLTRTAVPSSDDRFIAGALAKKKCWYEFPEKGWILANQRWPTYSAIPLALRSGPLAAGIKPDPTGPVWHAWGCSDNWPVSRDQYMGIFYGLGLAWLLVDDPSVKTRAKAQIEQALDYLAPRHSWNIVLPPENRIQTTFLGDFVKQLAFLRVGATINPTKYGPRYNAVKAAAAHTWIPVWLSGLDPLLQYYKFNLSSAALTLALMYETDPSIRAGYLYAHDVLWGSVRQHRNAYFDLLHILVQEPGRRALVAATPSALNPVPTTVSLRDEAIKALAEWTDRRKAVAGTNELPRDDMSTAAINYHQGLWPKSIGVYTGVVLTETLQATYALPVDMRTGNNMDFVWQRHPFNAAIPNTAGRTGTPGEQEVHQSGAPVARRGVENPGVDYLLPYWMAVYLGFLPK
ncbi:MAG: hypothetical protein ACXWZY_08445 [Gaiellaceae bacterium]